jgi:hypothetical protein
MKRVYCGSHPSILVITLVVGSLLGCASGEAGDGDAAGGREARVVPAGASMNFSVNETVSTETHSQGATFTATLRTGIADLEGSPAIPEGTRSRWLVTQSSTSGRDAALAVELEAVQIDGEWVPVVGEVIAADMDVDRGDSGSETAAKIGIGTAAGAILGQVLGGDTRSTLAGAGVGAAVGTTVALTTRDGNAVMPAGSSITIQLTEPLVIS